VAGRLPDVAESARLVLGFVQPAEGAAIQCTSSVLQHVGEVHHAAFAFSLLAVDLAVFAFERELEEQMGFVAETVPAACLELRSDLHQLGLGHPVSERLFSLLEIGAQTAQGQAVHAAIQEIANVVAVPELADILPFVDGNEAELLLEAVEQLVPDQCERISRALRAEQESFHSSQFGTRGSREWCLSAKQAAAPRPGGRRKRKRASRSDARSPLGWCSLRSARDRRRSAQIVRDESIVESGIRSCFTLPP
jgi:hypothetical protein